MIGEWAFFLLHFFPRSNSRMVNCSFYYFVCGLKKSSFTLVPGKQDLQQLEEWASDWGMKFSPTKCYILSVNPNTSFYYQLSNSILKHVQYNPYIGILLSNDFTWDSHISAITKKANSTLGFLRRNLKRCPPACKQQAYTSLVCPLLEYGAVV